MNAPQIETKVRATTTTPDQQNVVVLVTAIDSETEKGWLVYGYRIKRNSDRRVSMVPRLYFVSK